MFNLFNSCFCDAPHRWQFGIQDPATPAAIAMISFHNYLMVYIIFIGVFVCSMLFMASESVVEKPSKFSHSKILEITWTVIPAISLIFVAIPSFSLLYSLDDLSEPRITVKVIGHQWYWTYEFSNYYEKIKQSLDIRYDSYMMPTKELKYGNIRLLHTDRALFLPIRTPIQLLITSADVLHSWSVPSFGIKMDATPGRLSQVFVYIKRPGEFLGQCSEICGVNHGFMPICVLALPPLEFMALLDSEVDLKLKSKDLKK
jgi:cytochrome c oxidase subunit 2